MHITACVVSLRTQGSCAHGWWGWGLTFVVFMCYVCMHINVCVVSLRTQGSCAQRWWGWGLAFLVSLCQVLCVHAHHCMRGEPAHRNGGVGWGGVSGPSVCGTCPSKELGAGCASARGEGVGREGGGANCRVCA